MGTLLEFRKMGFYIYPTVTNTTYVGQDLDVSYGQFNTESINNPQNLIDERVIRGEPGRLKNMYLSVIINGVNATNNICYLPSPWEITFSIKNNLKVWDKCGACTLILNAVKQKCVGPIVLDNVEEINPEAIGPTSWVLQVYIVHIEKKWDYRQLEYVNK